MFVWQQTPGLGPSFYWYGFAGNLLVVSLAPTADSGVGDIALERLQSIPGA